MQGVEPCWHTEKVLFCLTSKSYSRKTTKSTCPWGSKGCFAQVGKLLLSTIEIGPIKTVGRLSYAFCRGTGTLFPERDAIVSIFTMSFSMPWAELASSPFPPLQWVESKKSQNKQKKCTRNDMFVLTQQHNSFQKWTGRSIRSGRAPSMHSH